MPADYLLHILLCVFTFLRVWRYFGEYSFEEMRAIDSVYVPGSNRGFLTCNTGHFGIQMPGAIL